MLSLITRCIGPKRSKSAPILSLPASGREGSRRRSPATARPITSPTDGFSGRRGTFCSGRHPGVLVLQHYRSLGLSTEFDLRIFAPRPSGRKAYGPAARRVRRRARRSPDKVQVGHVSVRMRIICIRPDRALSSPRIDLVGYPQLQLGHINNLKTLADLLQSICLAELDA